MFTDVCVFVLCILLGLVSSGNCEPEKKKQKTVEAHSSLKKVVRRC